LTTQYLKQVAPRSQSTRVDISEIVADVIADIRMRGDRAVQDYSEKFDSWSPTSFRLNGEEIERIVGTVPQQMIDDITFAQEQVRNFARHQLDSLKEIEVETLPGVFLGHKHVPVSAVGAYVPGGRFPLLASAHMTIVTAKVAGVGRVIACTPPIRGEIPSVTVAAMHLAGADEILLLGGVQAIAAMAVGTESIGRVDLLVGPGNAYVAEAKRQLFGGVGIDLFAGPTETLVIADDSAEPLTVAVDLLSQAEHGPDSPAVLITDSEQLAHEVIALIDKILPGMPTKDFAQPAWDNFGEVIVTSTIDEAFALANEYASEHVQVITTNPRQALDKMHDYGALFLGAGTCVSFGDKVIGTNHVLPTRGAARYTGGLWVGKFLKTCTYQEVRDAQSSALLGETCGRAARMEGFEGHARSGDLRAARENALELDWVKGALHSVQ
jgi:sulfopropanediol 3-dehydrogenase